MKNERKKQSLDIGKTTSFDGLSEYISKKERGGFFKKILSFLFWLFLLAIITYGGFFFWKVEKTFQEANPNSKSQSSFVETIKGLTAPKETIDLDGYDQGQINILLLGMAGDEKGGKNLTDTIILLSISTETKKVALLSLPRDFYVEVPEKNFKTKLNTLYQYGLNQKENSREDSFYIVKAVENVTSLPIHYWAIVSFQGFIDIVDSLGGINIMNERDIYDTRYPGPGYSYETFQLEKGFHHLDGETALKYVRERHSDPEGDFGRAKRQQQVMQAIKNKVFSLETFLNPFTINELLNVLGDNIKTNLNPGDMDDFIELSKQVDTQNINTSVVDAWNRDSLLKVSHIYFSGIRGFILIPRVGNYSEIQELAQNIFTLNEIERKKEEIQKEEAQIVLINKSSDGKIFSKIRKLLEESLNYKNIKVLYSSNKQTFPQTTVYDLTNASKPFTLNEIATKIPAKVSYDLPEEFLEDVEEKYVDIFLVIGEDLKEVYNMEEGSIEEWKSADPKEQLYFDIISNE